MSTPSLLNIPYRIKAGTLYSQIPENGDGDFTVTRTTTVANRSTRINSLGNIELVNDNVPRLDYPLGGAVNGCPALLVEPAATNGIRNNSMVGAVAGSPGTLPTNWSNSGSGLARQSVATGTLNGIPYVDIRISGTANNTYHDVFWDASNIIAALVGQDWVASCYLQIVAQPNPPVSYTLAMREFNSGGGFLGVFQGAALSISTTSFNRFSFTRVLNQATVAFVHPSLLITVFNGQPYDFTIRIGYPQMERGTVATSVIPTTTQAITRGAEVITRTSASALIGQSEGTIYAEVDIRNFVQTDRPIVQLFNDVNNRIRIEGFFFSPSFGLKATVTVLGSNVANITLTITNTGIYKLAFAYKQDDFALYINGVQVGFDISGSLPSNLSTIHLGHNNGSAQFNDRIRAFEIYPNRIPNTAAAGVISLATLTAL